MSFILASVLAFTASAAPDMKQAASATTSLVVAVLAEHRTVVSSEDVRKLLEAAADKSLAGCDDASSCLAEVADALGARHVVTGKLNRLGAQYVLEVTLLDAGRGNVLERVGVTRPDIDELAAALPAALQRVTAKIPVDADRVLVMDVETDQQNIAGATQDEVWSTLAATGSFIAATALAATSVAAYSYRAWATSEALAQAPAELKDELSLRYIPIGGGFVSEFDVGPLFAEDHAVLAVVEGAALALAVGSVALGVALLPAAEASE